METRLTFSYDDVGDILYINSVAPYPEQETEQLEYNVTLRRNPSTGVVENLEVLFFTRWLLKGGQPPVASLRELFTRPTAGAGA